MKAALALVVTLFACAYVNHAWAGTQCVTVSTKVHDEKTGQVLTRTQQVCWDTADGGTPIGPGTGGGYPLPGGPGEGGNAACPLLMLQKPDPCLGPQILAGATFGQGQYHPGSGLAAAITNISNAVLAPLTRTLISNALAVHTASLATGTVPYQTANTNLLNDIKFACSAQRAYDELHPPLTPWTGGISPALRACLGMMSRISGESGLSFGSFFIDWLNTIGVSLADLNVPQTLINWFAPENSLRVKNDLLFQGLRCNAWYREVLRNGC